MAKLRFTNDPTKQQARKKEMRKFKVEINGNQLMGAELETEYTTEAIQLFRQYLHEWADEVELSVEMIDEQEEGAKHG